METQKINGQKSRKNRKTRNGWKPLYKQCQGLTPATYKQLLEIKDLQNKLRNKPARKYGLENNQATKKKHEQIKVYLFFGAMGHHALAGRSTSLSHLAMEELWLNREDEWKRGGCGWLERKRGLKASMANITVCKRGVV